jgi:hypothetical protein
LKNSKSREKNEKLPKLFVQERDLRLHQMKEATKRLMSNEILQDRSIKLENAAKRYAAKKSKK